MKIASNALIAQAYEQHLTTAHIKLKVATHVDVKVRGSCGR